jgi:hypothetical protein
VNKKVTLPDGNSAGLWLVENLAQHVRITRDPQRGTVSVQLPTD